MSEMMYNPLTGKFDYVGEGGSGVDYGPAIRELQYALNQLSSNVTIALSERYLKTETYSKDEVDDNIAEAINTHIINVINNTEF